MLLRSVRGVGRSRQMRPDQFPQVQKLLQSGAFTENHFAKDLELSDPIVPALEYFLSLDAITGFDEKFKDLKQKPLGPKTTNDRRVQWASLCAELGAICLLGRTLGIDIVGFEQESPRAQRPKANCDVLALVHGNLTFIEVKRNAAEDKQLLPELLDEKLSALGLPLSIATELVDRNYDCSDLEVKLKELLRHVELFQAQINAGRATRPRPAPFDAGTFRVSFTGPNNPNSAPLEYFLPVFAEQLKPYLLGPGAPGKDGTPMKPMTTQAIEKGADYLFCRTPKWGDWAEIVGKCFTSVRYRNARTYFTLDATMLALGGIVLFSRYDDFCVINNLHAKDRPWLSA